MTVQEFMKLIRTSRGCHEWPLGMSSSGYGCVNIEGKDMSAHVASYLYTICCKEKFQVVRHSCHNRSCINPDHLSVGTYSDNTQDSIDHIGAPLKTFYEGEKWLMCRLHKGKIPISIIARMFKSNWRTIKKVLIKEGAYRNQKGAVC